MIEIAGIKKFFPQQGRIFSREMRSVKALRGISLNVADGETLGIVGESGSGKSTLARILTGLYSPTDGYFIADEFDSRKMKKKDWKLFRRKIGMVFQDPLSSLNPRFTLREILLEPLQIHSDDYATERMQRVKELIDLVGLGRDALGKYAHEFSGGQRQRIGIARALMLKPQYLILDEPVSALDVSIQAQILNLLIDLKKEFKLTCIFISHDLSVVRYLSDRVAVMYLGLIVESQMASTIFSDPRHHYTESLIKSRPDLNNIGADFHIVEGEIPSPVTPPDGCPFVTRCEAKKDICAAIQPERTDLSNGGFYHCHNPVQIE